MEDDEFIEDESDDAIEMYISEPLYIFDPKSQKYGMEIIYSVLVLFGLSMFCGS